ncbi:MAG: DUF222 domain-containing protein [Gemmatimonadetes bacterium]|nr:DUF222 domain-containing protein [Gemmatimonadota bacterium]
MIQFANTRHASPSTTHTKSSEGTERLGEEMEHPSDEVERLGDEIARLAAHIHAATYRLLALIREFDRREGWAAGFRSCAHWLSWRTGIAPGASREKVRVARALAELPLISGAMERGALSFSKARALTRVATAANEEALLELSEHGTAAHIEKIVRAWRRVDRQEDREEERERHESRYVDLHVDEDGMYVLRGRLDPEVGELLAKALAAAGDALYRKSEDGADAAAAPTAEHRRADALGLIAERALSVKSDEEGHPVGRAERYQVVLHVQANTGASGQQAAASGPPSAATGSQPGQSVLESSGINVPAGTSRRLSCDASLVVMTHDEDGSVLDVGRKRRTVPPPVRRALDYRDGGCRFPGCGLQYTDAHHILHWAEGGDTKLDNLVLLCRFHHRAVHEEGFRVELDGRGQPRFRRPNGTPLPAVPPAPNLGPSPVADLEREHRSLGVAPGAHTTTPLWLGEPLDLGLAIDLLRA